MFCPTNFCFGQPLSPLEEYEYRGESLAERIARDDECHFIVNSFDVRMKHGDEKGTFEFSYAFKNSTTHIVKSFKGIPKNKTYLVKENFERNIFQTIEKICLFADKAP